MTAVPHRSDGLAGGPPPPLGRLLGLLGLMLVVAAGVLWGSSRLTWVSQVVESATGPRTSTADGAGAEPILVPWALLCLAAVGGLVATAGWGRRVVGTLVAVAGLWAVLRGAAGLVAPTSHALPLGVRPGDRPLPAEAVVPGPLLAVLGGLVMLAAGLLAVRWAGVLPRMGARYDAPGERRPAPADPDRALWEALDEGSDPTADPLSEPAADPPADTVGGRGDDQVHDPGADPPPGPSAGGPPDSGGRRARGSGLTWNELGRGKGADPA